MRRLNSIIFVCLLLVACGPSDEQKAQKFLEAAKLSYQEGNYTRAKTELDSIKIKYPKAFDTRKAGIRFMLEVEQAEQERGLKYLDSLEIAKQEEFQALQKDYLLEKNKEYQEIGYYIIPQQKLEQNLNRSYLRFQVNEKGIMSVTATYAGKKGINLQTVKIAAPDGSFVETPISDNNFVSQNLGIVSEKSDFKRGKDGDLIPFILMHHDKDLKVSYLGDWTYQFKLSAVEKRAAIEIDKLAKVLYTLTEIQKAKEEALLKLSFIASRKQKNDSIDHPEQNN